MRKRHEGIPKAVHALLHRQDFFTFAELREESGASTSAVQRHLAELVELGLLGILDGGPVTEYAWASKDVASLSLSQFQAEIRKRLRARRAGNAPPPATVVARVRDNALEILVPNEGVTAEEADPALSFFRTREGRIAGFQVKDYDRHFFRTAFGNYLFSRDRLTVNLVLSIALAAIDSEIERKGKASDPESTERLVRLEGRLIDLRRALGTAEIAYESAENRALLQKRPK